MIARRLVVSLVLLALVSNVLVLAGPSRTAAPRPEGQAFTLVSLRHETVGALTRILVESDAPPLYTVFRPTDRLIIVDMPGGEGSRLAPAYAIKNTLVDSITVRQTRVGSDTSGRAVTRLEIATRGEFRDRSSINGNLLILELSPEQSSAAKAQPSESAGVYVHPVPISSRNSAPAGSSRTEAARDRALPQPASLKAESLKPATLVRAVRSETMEAGLRVFLETDGAAQFKDFVLADPWRVVIDVTGVRSAFGNKVVSVGAAGVDRVRVGEPGPNVVRVVLDTRSKVVYRVVREGASLVIHVGNTSQARSDSVKPQPQTVRELQIASQRVENNQESAANTSDLSVASNLIAQTGKPVVGGPAAGQPNTGPRGVAPLNKPVPQPMTQPATSSPNSARETVVQPVQPSTTRSVMDVQRPAPVPSSPGASGRSELSFCERGYAGGLISFDLRSGVDIRDMLRFISQQYGINFIVDKSVAQVPVDIRVTDIPWNQVMDSVLRANRLGAVCESGIVRIATLAAIKEEREQQRGIEEEMRKAIPLQTKIIRLKYARAAGSLGATGSGRAGGSGSSGGGGGGGQSGDNKGGLIAIINSRLSPRGRIEMDARSNKLIVTDLPENIKTVEDIIAQLDRPEPQVEIEARIVIANRNFLRDIGNELAGAGINRNSGAIGFLQTGATQLSPGGVTTPTGQGGGGGGGGGDEDKKGSANTGQIGPNLLGPFATNSMRVGTANTVLSLTTGLMGTSILSLALSASERKGQIRIVASPRITAQDNQTAEIINGVQIPVQTVTNGTITTTFITAALRLEITPQIIEDTGEVLMHVVAENNTVNSALATTLNGGTPGINTQSAESIVRVQDGGTTVMGGVNIDTESQSQNRTPGISRVPLLGELFKRRTTERSTDEILFFITPRIVREDGQIGPRNINPQRSSLEQPNQTEAGAQRAAAPAGQAKPEAPKPAQANALTGVKGGQ